jgi:hypothetical protein
VIVSTEAKTRLGTKEVLSNSWGDSLQHIKSILFKDTEKKKAFYGGAPKTMPTTKENFFVTNK